MVSAKAVSAARTAALPASQYHAEQELLGVRTAGCKSTHHGDAWRPPLFPWLEASASGKSPGWAQSACQASHRSKRSTRPNHGRLEAHTRREAQELARALQADGTLEVQDVLHSLALSEAVYRVLDEGPEAAEEGLQHLLRQFPDHLVALHNIQWRQTPGQQRYMTAEGVGAVYVCFMGTKQTRDLWTNANLLLDPIDGPSSETQQQGETPKAHRGFLRRAATVPLEQLQAAAAAAGKRLVLCGHSLGGAVAALCTLRLLQQLPPGARADIACIGFATPAVGNAALARMVADASWEKHFTNYLLPEDFVPRLLSLGQTVPLLELDAAPSNALPPPPGTTANATAARIASQQSRAGAQRDAGRVSYLAGANNIQPYPPARKRHRMLMPLHRSAAAAHTTAETASSSHPEQLPCSMQTLLPIPPVPLPAPSAVAALDAAPGTEISSGVVSRALLTVVISQQQQLLRQAGLVVGFGGLGSGLSLGFGGAAVGSISMHGVLGWGLAAGAAVGGALLLKCVFQALRTKAGHLGYVPLGRQLYLLPTGASTAGPGGLPTMQNSSACSTVPDPALDLLIGEGLAEAAAERLAAAGLRREEPQVLRRRMRFALTLCPAAHRVPSYRARVFEIIQAAEAPRPPCTTPEQQAAAMDEAQLKAPWRETLPQQGCLAGR